MVRKGELIAKLVAALVLTVIVGSLAYAYSKPDAETQDFLDGMENIGRDG